MTEKSSLYNEYFSKLFQIWENAVTKSTNNTIKNGILQNDPKLKTDKLNEFNDYMKDVMSKNMSKQTISLIDDIETINDSIDKEHLQSDILKKKINKLTNPNVLSSKDKK